MPTVTIPGRFNGPPGSGNGGYSCGAIADAIGEQVEVTLRQPPPLETPMEIIDDGERWRVLHGDLLIAEAVRVDPPTPPPLAPTLAEAEAAMGRYLGHTRHDFPMCFTCGTGRDDNLAVFSGAVAGSDLVAAIWVPDPSLPNEDGAVTVPIVWSAIDCPGAWTAMRAQTDAPVVLGRMSAHIERAPTIGETTIVYGWPLGGEGRKAFAGTALADADGNPIAWAIQTWIALE